MTVLVCGATGLLGRDLCKLFKNKNINYIGTYNTNFIENYIKINFCDKNDIYNSFINIKPSICINCIVERQLEICEGDWNKIKKTNIDIANNIATICNDMNIHLIHISTDYVFDGLNPPYYPESRTNPLQNYGMSKLISELKVINKCTKYTIIRVPVLYSDNITNLEENAVTLIGKKILNRIENFKEDNFSIRRPNYIPDFCKFIYDIIIKPEIGIFHFCNPYDKITKYEMSNIIANYLNKNNNIIPINEEPKDGAERPKDTYLIDNKYDIKKYNFTSIEQGLELCFQKLYHPPLNLNNNKNTTDLFFLIDLDGTLLDSDYIHYEGYKYAFNMINKQLFYDEYLDIINTIGIDKYLDNEYPNYKKIIKENKNLNIKNRKKIDLIKNADKLINYIFKYNINHVVVTNTSNENVIFFKSLIPELNKLKNWITRENYIEPKPNKECYELAKKIYYNNEKYIIGIENNINGYKSLRNITECIYIITNKNDKQYHYFKNNDVYLIEDFLSIFE